MSSMTLLRPRSREVYRVYSEEEYLDGAGSELTGAGDWPAAVEPAVGLVAEELPVAVEPGLEPANESPLTQEPAVDSKPVDAVEEHVYGGFVNSARGLCVCAGWPEWRCWLGPWERWAVWSG